MWTKRKEEEKGMPHWRVKKTRQNITNAKKGAADIKTSLLYMNTVPYVLSLVQKYIVFAVKIGQVYLHIDFPIV